VEVEVRSVNNRGLKVNLRTSDCLSGLAPKLEEQVRARLTRGSVFLQARVHRLSQGSAYQLDAALCERFFAQLKSLGERLGEPSPSLAQVASLPGVVREEEAAQDQDLLFKTTLEAAEAALDHLLGMRAKEGLGIQADLLGHVSAIEAQADQVALAAPKAVEASAERMRGRIAQLMKPHELDARELAREVALLADKCDIAEELQRLRSHTGQLREAIEGAQGPVGRKLEFLAQELVREANTMANKSHDPALVATVLGIKLDVERIREQLANVE